MKNQRVNGIDIFRGVALLLMILYHFTYDLNYFHFITVDMNHTFAFQLFRYTIMSMFLLSVGMSLVLLHHSSIEWRSVQQRIIQLGGASLIVTIATYFIFPYSWIYFGILHFIFIASLLALLFLPYPKITLMTALLILIGSATQLLNMTGLYHFMKPILHLPRYTEDLVPFIPWFAAVLLGMSLVQYQLHLKLFTSSIFSDKFSLNRVLKKMGQHSLLIYLIHQPILFTGFILFTSLFSKS